MIENSEPALYAVTETLAAHETSAMIEGRSGISAIASASWR